MDLATIWFILVFVLLAGYAILDGFDLGVGMLHLTGRTDNERRTGLQAIAPVWDGNEVWLLTAGGALFAAFPFVYATVFSSMYLALYLVLAGLIGRAVALEFRSKEESEGWRRRWDVVFFLGSLLPSLLFGVAFGNVIRGLPLEVIGGQVQFTGNFFTLLNPFSLCVGVLSVLLFLLQGSLFLAAKSDGRQQERMRKLIPAFWLLAAAVYAGLSIFASAAMPQLYGKVGGQGVFWVLLIGMCVAMLAVPVLAFAGKYGRALVASSVMLGLMMAIAGVAIYPNLVLSSSGMPNSLSIQKYASSPLTLRTMLIIALLGMPLVIGYTVWIYRVFRGKTVVHPEGY